MPSPAAAQSAAERAQEERLREHEARRRALFGSRLDERSWDGWGFATPRGSATATPFTLGCGTPLISGFGGWCPPPPFGFRFPQPITLPPEERPHRFFERYHPGEGPGVPPLTCDPLSAAGCPPDPRYRDGWMEPRAVVPVPGRAAGVPACVEVSARSVTGVLYVGRLQLPALGASRVDDVAVAIQAALARGESVSLIGRHGYPIHLPPAGWIQTIAAAPCLR